MESDEVVVGEENNKWFIVVFSILCAIIVGLVIGIVVINIDKSNKDKTTSAVEPMSEEGEQVVDATGVCGDAETKYDSGVYTYEDAVSNMDKSLNNSTDANYRVTLATCYAGFVGDNGEDMNEAINILRSVEDEIGGVSSGIAVRYYSQAVRISGSDEELSSYYETKLSSYNREGGVINEE